MHLWKKIKKTKVIKMEAALKIDETVPNVKGTFSRMTINVLFEILNGVFFYAIRIVCIVDMISNFMK